jgi:hypothetical protein
MNEKIVEKANRRVTAQSNRPIETFFEFLAHRQLSPQQMSPDT